MQDFTNFINHHLPLIYAMSIMLVLLMIIEYFRLARNNFSVDTTKAIALINHEHAAVIDLRSKEQFQQGHIIDAQSTTVSEMESHPKKLEKLRTKPILFVCANGLESQKVAALYTKKGYNSYSLSGGLRSWVAAGLPLIKE